METFTAGWNAIPTEIQARWSQYGILKQGYPERLRIVTFLGWTDYVYERQREMAHVEEYRINQGPLWQLMVEKMDHIGVVYGQPRFTTTGDHDDLKSWISQIAIRRYVAHETKKAIAKMTDEINEKGVAAILSYFKENDLE